jgi:hypothetical protein
MPAAIDASTDTEPGLLYVLTRPKASCEKDYHEWYNTEHGPQRMQLDFVRNGYRYTEAPLTESRDGQSGEELTYMAMYDLSRLSGLDGPEYTSMRSHRSARETEVLTEKMDLVDRRTYTLITSRGACKMPAPVVMTVTLVAERNLTEEIHRWYEEEHTRDLSKIPGWRRTRRYRRMGGAGQREGHDVVELLAVHEFEMSNGLDGPEHVFARNRPWRNSIMSQVESRENKRWNFLHEFKADDYRRP